MPKGYRGRAVDWAWRLRERLGSFDPENWFPVRISSVELEKWTLIDFSLQIDFSPRRLSRKRARIDNCEEKDVDKICARHEEREKEGTNRFDVIETKLLYRFISRRTLVERKFDVENIHRRLETRELETSDVADDAALLFDWETNWV